MVYQQTSENQVTSSQRDIAFIDIFDFLESTKRVIIEIPKKSKNIVLNIYRLIRLIDLLYFIVYIRFLVNFLNI